MKIECDGKKNEFECGKNDKNEIECTVFYAKIQLNASQVAGYGIKSQQIIFVPLRSKILHLKILYNIG